MVTSSTPVRILIVEDNSEYVALLQELLRATSEEVRTEHAPDLQTALHRLGSEQFDVVVLDLMLPDSAGMETLSRLAHHAPLLPVVVLTAVDDAHITETALREGAQDFLHKSQVDGDLLYRSIRYAIDRHSFEAKLLASEQRYRSLIEGSTHGILIHANGVVQLANDALIRLVGLSSTDLVVGRSIWPFVAPDDQPRVQQMMSGRAQGESVPDTYEFRAVRTDGAVVWLECAPTAITWDGAPAVMATMLDVSERKRTEEQLRQAQKMEAVGRLAGGIAHDFNNLLVVIGGTSDLLLEDLGHEHPAASGLRQIEAAANSAGNLTRQLLAFSRRQLLQPQIIDLNTVLRRVQSLLSRVIGEDIVLTIDAQTDLPRVMADPGQIEQVLLNLAVNARDAMPHGGSLTIRTAAADLDATFVKRHPNGRTGSHVMIAVVDTGAGMDENTQKRLFEPFFTTKELGKGTGLGLATVYGIVEQSGGFICVNSAIGTGSTFAVFLPRTMAMPGLDADAAGPLGLRGHETVLLIEDQPAVLAVARAALQRFGYSVIEAAGGDQALAMLQRFNGHVHIVVSDVVLRGMSGRDAARRITALRPGTRVLYMSGYTDDVILHHGVLERGLAFLEKPFTPTALVRKVREVLDAPLAPGI